MLLAVAAACAGETVEVPGETVVVEKVVTETVEVPGETVVVEKEVIKTVEVPGETVTKEVVKEVMVPGETVVVKEEVVKTVEVPGETVTVEVVKTVEVPGETVVVEKEVVKTVEVPGQTVVVEKEVVKTVEVPGQTVVVEKVVVQEVAGKKYVTDPSTGKVVSAPQYGGTITYVVKEEPSHVDAPLDLHGQGIAILVVERLAIPDWATPRDKFPFQNWDPPKYTIGSLAESWETPDDKTIIVKVRKGVHWHDKAPMNGRELTAQDIEYNYHRVTGMGSGFTEPSEFAWVLKTLPFESITATDKYTVVLKLKKPHLVAMGALLSEGVALIYPPEVIKKHGDVTDWRNLVGTGPFVLTDWTAGSSRTYTKNPDYWGFDEKYPENRLPYVDKLRALVMPEVATQLAALRSGKVDYMGVTGAAQIRIIDQVESLERTNPEIEMWPYATRSDNGFAMNIQKPPFDDIRVRKAMQMALDLQTITNSYFKGYADPIPQGRVGRFMTEVATQFEDWPEEVKKGHMYDPEGAEALLDAAGLPRGADGIRFKTVLTHLERYDASYAELAASYWAKIGVDVEVQVTPLAQFSAARKGRTHEMMSTEPGYKLPNVWALAILNYFQKDTPGNSANVNDPTFEAMLKAAAAATTWEERNRIAKEMNMYAIERYWNLYGPVALQHSASQPWLIGFNGETAMAAVVFTRLWIDSELKEAMGY